MDKERTFSNSRYLTMPLKVEDEVLYGKELLELDKHLKESSKLSLMSLSTFIFSNNGNFLVGKEVTGYESASAIPLGMALLDLYETKSSGVKLELPLRKEKLSQVGLNTENWQVIELRFEEIKPKLSSIITFCYEIRDKFVKPLS